MGLEATPTTGTGTPADAPPQPTELRSTPKSEDDGGYQASQIKGAPEEVPTQLIQDPRGTRGRGLNRSKEAP